MSYKQIWGIITNKLEIHDQLGFELETHGTKIVHARNSAMLLHQRPKLSFTDLFL
jgi:hypothetical protein